MAGSFELNVQDSGSVQAWKERAQALNENAERTIREASQVLTEFKDTAEGNIFFFLCSSGEQMISGMTQVMKGMAEILSAVDNLMNMIKQKSQDLVSGVVDVVRNVFG